MKKIINSADEAINNDLKTAFEADRNSIEKISLCILFILIVAIILISLRLVLVAGLFVITACVLGLVLFRKLFTLLNELSDKLSETSESIEKKDDVITEFSHRIREPLNNLVLISEMLINSNVQKTQKELIETLIASTKNMVDVVNDLTMQSAGISYEGRKKIPFNLFSTIQNTIDLFNLKDSLNIDFILNKNEINNFEVTGDPIVLKQIFLDLFNIINSQSKEKKTKVTISLKKERETEKESILNFTIHTDKNIVFIDEGINYGRHTIKLIAEAGGRYSQESGPDYSVFAFTLPFLKVMEEGKKQILSTEKESLRVRQKPSKELKNANILLVEDNQINQKITMLTLKPLVNLIDTASTGMEAIEKFQCASYDIILMDIQMPVMSGLVAAEKIRELEVNTSKHVSIIAITANAMLGDKERCISAGMDDYISKPFQPSALIEIIKKHL
ncbi:MAG TPA: response regulator [Bacteroidales bacterium]|nr:response regulator [Bacteroidales bacterium]